jgi:YggT family protein
MDTVALVHALRLFARILELIVFVSVVLSYFLSPFHPLRVTLDRIVEPLLAPIRRVMPQTGAIDLSPVVLIALIELFLFILRMLFIS